MNDVTNDFIGIKPIGEMTKEELIDEIIDVNRVNLNKQNMDELRMGVVNLRLADYKNRLIAGIGFKTIWSPLGDMYEKDDENDD